MTYMTYMLAKRFFCPLKNKCLKGKFQNEFVDVAFLN